MKIIYKKFYRRKTIERWKFDAQSVVMATLSVALLFSMYQNSQLSTQATTLGNQVVQAKDKEVSVAKWMNFGAIIKEVEKEVKVYETPKTVEDKIRATFPEDPDMAIAIFKCESDLNPKAFNGKNTNGSWDAGLAQVNSVHGVARPMLMDVDVNLAVARVIYENAGNSWNPWVCYRKVK